MKEVKLEIKKIPGKKEKLDVRGQGCWDDCRVWRNNTTTPKCSLSSLATILVSFNGRCTV